MSDRASAKVQAQQKTSSGSSPKNGLLQRTCACGQHTIGGGECEACRKTHEGTMQRAAVSSAPMNAVPPVVHDVLSSPGQSLDAGTRTFMDPRFGHDFSRVRVHTDAQASESARAMNALAYTVGHDIVFGAGRFGYETHEGRRLLAHELTHVVQQSGLNGIRVDKPNAGGRLSPMASEKEADKVADGAHHMAFIIYGKVVEVHWETEATDVNLIEQTDLEKWAVGPESGYHYFASGAIVAPAADIDAAFK